MDAREALGKCRDQFNVYANLHLSKTPPDTAKAETNRQMVELCEAALSEVREVTGINDAARGIPTKQSSPELSSLAAKILRADAPSCWDADSLRIEFGELLGDAKRLAGSVLSQDETPGQSNIRTFTKEEFEAEYPATNDLPEPNAPAPDALRAEMINIVLQSSKCSSFQCGQIVDGILKKQMQFYASMADPQLEADSVEQMAVVTEARGIIAALIQQTGAMAELMTSDNRAKWQRLAARGRELAAKMEAMFS